MLRRMGEQVQPEDDVVAEWEAGLPTADNLTPLSKSLIPPELASAFKITPETPRTAMDVHRASQSTLSSLGSYPFVTNPDDLDGPDPVPDSKKTRRTDEDKSPTADEDQSTANKTALKRPRLVWTAELHNRFVQVVARLGLNNAVPKTIMQLMNVDGLTRENVASHLQKYRLYIKRQGLLNDGLLPSDHHQLFAQQSFAESSNANGIENHNSSRTGTSETNHLNHIHSYGQTMMPIAMPYNHHHHHHPQMMQMPMTSSSGHGFHSYHNQQHRKYNRMVQQQSDWSGNDNKRNGY